MNIYLMFKNDFKKIIIGNLMKNFKLKLVKLTRKTYTPKFGIQVLGFWILVIFWHGQYLQDVGNLNKLSKIYYDFKPSWEFKFINLPALDYV